MPDDADFASMLNRRSFSDAELACAQVPTSRRLPGRLFRWDGALYEVSRQAAAVIGYAAEGSARHVVVVTTGRLEQTVGRWLDYHARGQLHRRTGGVLKLSGCTLRTVTVERIHRLRGGHADAAWLALDPISLDELRALLFEITDLARPAQQPGG